MTPSSLISQRSAVAPHPNPAWEETKRRLWAMTPDERRAAMYAGTLTFKLCLHWASQAPLEVPIINGEFWFIAILTPEIADAPAPTEEGRTCRP